MDALFITWVILRDPFCQRSRARRQNQSGKEKAYTLQTTFLNEKTANLHLPPFHCSPKTKPLVFNYTPDFVSDSYWYSVRFPEAGETSDAGGGARCGGNSAGRTIPGGLK